MREDYSAELISVIRQVRRRWRMKVALRGALFVAVLTVAIFLISARALEAARFTPEAIFAFRLGFVVVMAGLIAFMLVRPLVRRVTDHQVAMYLEEHEPSLQAAIISALEAERDTSTPVSQGLVRKLIEEAIAKARSAVEKTRSAIAAKDTTQLKEQVDQLARTQRMFKGVVSRG